MKQLTISYLDHMLCLRSAFALPSLKARSEAALITDENLDLCFDTLKQGWDVNVVCQNGLRKAANYLMDNYIFVKAAGGLVQAPDGSRLLISREGHWDIPKGMVEQGETIAQAAVREVREETGLTQISLGNLIAKTYHIYDKYGGWHLKQTSWYQMTSPCICDTLPQKEEGITQAVWVSPQECKERLRNSFASLRLLSENL